MSRIERGQIAPKFERLENIANILQCSVAELFIPEKQGADLQNINENLKKIAEQLQELTPKEKKIIFTALKAIAEILKS